MKINSRTNTIIYWVFIIMIGYMLIRIVPSLIVNGLEQGKIKVQHESGKN